MGKCGRRRFIGIGLACAKRLLEAGSRVFLAGVDEAEEASAVEALGELSPPGRRWRLRFHRRP